MNADSAKPDQKWLFSNGKIQVLFAQNDQLTIYARRQEPREIEAYLVLGLGAAEG